jgi:hypothetical protein
MAERFASKTTSVKTVDPLKTVIVLNNSVAIGLLVVTFFVIAFVILPPFPLSRSSRTASVVATYPTEVIRILDLEMLSATLAEDDPILNAWEESLVQQESQLTTMTVETAFAAKHFALLVVVVQLRESIQLEQEARQAGSPEEKERQHAEALKRFEEARTRWTTLHKDLSWLPDSF